MTDLIGRLKKKDEAALKEVMAMYKNKILNYLYRMLGDREMAEDLTQETFVKVYFKAGSLRTENLKPWIYKIATNLARSQLRKAKIRNALSLSDAGGPALAYETSYKDTVELEQLLSVLPEKYRIVLVMKEIDNFSFDEMAGILKKPVGTLKALVFRGRRKLISHLALENGSGGSHG